MTDPPIILTNSDAADFQRKLLQAAVATLQRAAKYRLWMDDFERSFFGKSDAERWAEADRDGLPESYDVLYRNAKNAELHDEDPFAALNIDLLERKLVKVAELRDVDPQDAAPVVNPARAHVFATRALGVIAWNRARRRFASQLARRLTFTRSPGALMRLMLNLLDSVIQQSVLHSSSYEHRDLSPPVSSVAASAGPRAPNVVAAA